VSTGVPSRQRANAGLDQNPVTSSIIFREGAPSRDPQVLIIAPTRRRSRCRTESADPHYGADFALCHPTGPGLGWGGH
ncbi:hypothetical protein, partial [Nocardia farcinica]|uniref:hypothetical protein n=1 Tax=Nocardia farcinica TaxID=37329 RepID=UPI001E4F3E19